RNSAISTTSGSFDAKRVARAETARLLPRKGLRIALALAQMLNEQVAAERARGTAAGARRRVAPPLGQERELHLRERLELPDDPVAAAESAALAGAAPDRVLPHPERELELERLDRRVQGVAHRDVDGRRPVRVGARALTACN